LTGIDSEIVKADYTLELDYEELVASPTEMNWLGKGILTTEVEFAFWEVTLGQKAETVFMPVTSQAYETSYSVTFDSEVFSHSTESKVYWQTGDKLDDFVNKERLTIKVATETSFQFTLDWTFDASPSVADDERMLKDLVFGSSIKVKDFAEIGVKFRYPYLFGSRKIYDRLRIEVNDLSIGEVSWRNASIDFTTGFSEFDSKYKYPEKYFTKSETQAQFLLWQSTRLSVSSLSVGEYFIATSTASETGDTAYSFGISNVKLGNKPLLGGTNAEFDEFGLSMELRKSEDLYFTMHINELYFPMGSISDTPGVLNRLSLGIDGSGKRSFVEIGTYTGDISMWDESIAKVSPMYFDLHCMALEFILRLSFGSDVTTIQDTVESIALKYYIKELKDRYFVIGLYKGAPFFRFRF
jgi:hypothetical protein